MIVREETVIFSFLFIYFSDRYNDFEWELYGNYFNKMYVRKQQCYHYLGMIFLIKTMSSVFQCVEITTLKLLKLSITTMPYVLMLLTCMNLSSFILGLFIGWFRHRYREFSRTTAWIWLFCFKYLWFFILLVFWFRRSDSNSEIWYLFQIHFKKKKLLYTDPRLIRQCKFCKCYHVHQLTKPTLLCVVTLCFWLSSLYNQGSPFLEFVVLFIVVVVTVIVVRNYILGMDCLVLIPLGTIIYLLLSGGRW